MQTRRTFLTAVSAGAAALGAAKKKLRIGIGAYSYHSLTMEAMIKQLQALHVREIEMSRGEFMLLSHPKPERFEAARRLLDEGAISCVSYYAATIHNVEEADLAIRFAKILGSSNITGDAVGAPLLKHIDEACTAAGLTFGIHNHYFKHKFPYESPDDVLRGLQGLSKTVGATADVGQFASCGHDPVEAIRKLGPHLKLVHLKDIAASGDEVNVLLGRGAARIPGVMLELRKLNFGGLVAVEYEKEGPVEDDLRIEVNYARSLA